MRAKFLLACFLAASASFASSAFAAEKPADFSYGLTLRTDGKDALYRLELPTSVYQGMASRDRADVRVFNAAGEVVPHAFRYRTATDEIRSAPIALKIFPIYGEETTNLDGLVVDVQRTATGSIIKLNRQPAERSRKLRAYLLDASMIGQPLQSLELDVKTAPASTYVARATLEASDDLATWRMVVAEAPLVSLEHGGERLEQRRIMFAASKARYFRISWRGMPDEAVLAGVLAEAGNARVDTARAWENVTGHLDADKAGEYLFDAQGHFPADRIRLELPQANSIAQFQLFARNRSTDPWHPITHGLWYRLNRDGSELLSPPLAIATNADRYWRLKVDQKGGGIGAGEPRLGLGWVAQDLVFSARGEGPFTLAFGNREAKAAAYPIESLVPGYQSDSGTGLGIRAATVMSPPSSIGQNPALQPAAVRTPDESIDVKKWILWSCLVVGVLLLAWMAWRLLKQMDVDGAAPASESDQTGGK